MSAIILKGIPVSDTSREMLQVQLVFLQILQTMATSLNKQEPTSANSVLYLPETGKYIEFHKKNIWIFTIVEIFPSSEKI